MKKKIFVIEKRIVFKTCFQKNKNKKEELLAGLVFLKL